MAAHNILGTLGENMAARYLRQQGMKILERNWRIGDLETDIIAQDKDTLVFCEVKTRTAGQAKKPEEAVDRKRQQRLIAGAQAYIRYNRLDNPWRFDIVAIEIGFMHKEIVHFPDAFLPHVRTINSQSYSGQKNWNKSKQSTRRKGI